MRVVIKLIALLVACCPVLTGCDEVAPEQRPLEQMFTSDQQQRLRWSQADRPAIADLEGDFVYSYAELPTEGEANRVPWASDYWPTYKDSVNFRWSGADVSSPAEKFAAAFDKPNIGAGVSWGYGVRSQPHADRCSETADCEVENGNSKVCAKEVGADTGYCIEDWTGICHAWAPAAIMHPEPQRPITHNGVEFSITDLKALVSLAYDKGLNSVFLGTRCNLDLDDEENGVTYDSYGRPETYVDANGSVVDCKDTNPGSLHVVLANMIGRQGQSLVEDRTVDYQVWNQPIRGYEVLSSAEVTAREANELIGVVVGGIEESQSGAIPEAEWRHYGPFDAEAGSQAVARMTGTGDADLYVRFGAQPTTQSYDCRPYGDDANETCDLVVPEGQAQVFVSVFAYRVAAGEETVSFELDMNIGGSIPETYILNEDARNLRSVRTRVDWITEAYALPQNDRNLSESMDNFTRSDTYDYILEMDDAGVIIGGEWLGASKRAHPDFLWVPTLKSEFELARPPVELMNVTDRAVGESEWAHLGSVAVDPGEEVKVILTGSGNGDLYLGLNAQPSEVSYACKPTTEDSKEICGGVMPNGYNRIFVSVRGAAADTVVNVEAVKFIDGTGITWSEVEGLLSQSLEVDPCVDNNGGCGDAALVTCSTEDGVAVCNDVDECALDNGGCGDSTLVACTNNVGAAATCSDINECSTNNGGCGNAVFMSCVNNEAAPATCADIDECASDNGGCGDAQFMTCTNNVGAEPDCSDIDECSTNNGDCGDAQFMACANNLGAAPDCTDIDECANENGGCGDAQFMTCTNNVGAEPDCSDIDECATDNGGCGPADLFVCTNNVGAAPTCSGGEVELANPLLDDDAACDLYRLDRIEGFTSNGDYQRNWGGLGEKWFRDGLGGSIFIQPNGDVKRWDGQSSPPDGQLITQVDGVVHENPALLHDAQEIAGGCPASSAEPSLVVARRAYRIDAAMGFASAGSYATNWGGRGEKWFINGSRGWFYIELDGTIVRWDGQRPIGGDVVGVLSPEYHAEPNRLLDAHDPDAYACDGGPEAYTAYDLDRALELTFAGSYAENWGGLGERWMFSSATNRWHYITPNGDVFRWLRNSSPATGTLAGTLSADFHADPSRLHEAVLPTAGFCEGDLAGPGLGALAAQTDTELGLYKNRSYYNNWAGMNEKWMASRSGSWFYLLPNGALYRWSNGQTPVEGELITTFDADYYENPAMLHEAGQD